MPDQAPLPAEENVDDLMRRKVRELHLAFEPFAVDNATLETMPIMSLAISMKRIADKLDITTINVELGQIRASINNLHMVVQQAANVRHDDAVALKNVLYGLDSTIAHNTGRELRINISKD